jgi:hypothetical protein
MKKLARPSKMTYRSLAVASGALAALMLAKHFYAWGLEPATDWGRLAAVLACTALAWVSWKRSR